MAATSLIAAGVAGCYGILHDQITYSLSPEYFTHFKFEQFEQADFELPPRVFVAEIGFLATWWVGLIAGWFLARVALPLSLIKTANRRIRHAIGIMFGFAISGGLMGFSYAKAIPPSPNWLGWAANIGATDAQSAIDVGCIHIGSYAGALAGFFVAILYLLRLKKLAKA